MRTVQEMEVVGPERVILRPYVFPGADIAGIGSVLIERDEPTAEACMGPFFGVCESVMLSEWHKLAIYSPDDILCLSIVRGLFCEK